jgi:drug/metabolite transporter (DMT)-like permease
MTPNKGEIAALLTAMCYSISSIFFTFAGRKFGPLVSNRLRLIVAILLLGITHWIVFGNPFPLDSGIQRWFWLGISGIVGLAIGDLFLFQAYISLGPRLGLLFLSLSPALASLLAWLLLGETLSGGNILGIILTLVGIVWVVLESNTQEKSIIDTNIGIARTIIALPPIFLLPVGHFLFKEHISWRAIAGTLIAVAGVGLLFWL